MFCSILFGILLEKRLDDWACKDEFGMDVEPSSFFPRGWGSPSFLHSHLSFFAECVLLFEPNTLMRYGTVWRV